MKKDSKGRISLTESEADEIREYLETLYAMEGTLDEDFNAECHRAGFFARKLYRLLHGEGNPIFPVAPPPEPKYNPYE